MGDSMEKKEKKKEPLPKSNKSFCSCTCLLYTLALIGVVIAGGYYYINHGCDLSNEHEEMKCSVIFFLRTMPIIAGWRIRIIDRLANWGLVDFKQSTRSYLDTRDMNTTHLYTHNITQAPVLTQEWEYNGFKLYSYTPEELVDVSNQPVVIHLHGGGGIMFSPMFYDASIRHMVDKYKIKFIVPDYPKSPEVVFPTAHDICVNAVKYVFENSEMFSVDPKRVSLSGDSFGGNAVLYVAFKWRELDYYKKYHPLHTLILIYPWVQFVNLELDSYKQEVNQRIISQDSVSITTSFLIKGDLDLTELLKNSSLPLMSQYYQQRQTAVPELLPKLDWEPSQSMVDKYSHYADTVLDPYASFLFQTDFSHLPPTLLINAGYDILLSEGLLLKQRMEESGVDVEHHVAEKIFHGFFDFLIPGVIHTPTLIGFDKMGEFLQKHT
eukprot:TRINITY_DN1422_c0_g2_i6.p1 TRINITY_DN1422_c0_g2~~TRINITY_DN1422_c0_g2_i6.p1  ORF type:complete len:437 (-),score=75.84 TRINITY_DN1422_c0_g2_i6:24-1334(-)